MSSFLERFTSEVERVGVSTIANTLGVARNTIYNWMAKGNAPLNYLLALSGMGLDIGYVLSGKRGSLNDEGNYILNDQEKILFNSFRLCSPDAQKTILKTTALLAAGIENESSSATFNNAGANIKNQIGTNTAPITFNKGGKNK